MKKRTKVSAHHVKGHTVKGHHVARHHVKHHLIKEHYRKLPRQTGKTNVRRDKKRLARPVGWRVSRSSDRRYYEGRRNRSDRSRSRRL